MSRYTEIERTDKIGPSRVTLNNNFQSLESLINERIYNLNWKDSVLTITDEGTATQTLGNRYISNVTGILWTEDYIYEWDGSDWVETIISSGDACVVEDETMIYFYISSTWVKLSSTVIHNDLDGLQGGNATERYHVSSINHITLTGGLDAQSLHYHDTETTVPLTHNDTGIEGQWAKDTIYYYYCVDTDTWVRRAVETSF